MAVNFSIKNVPAPIARKIRERAARNHRSLQGELLALLERGAAEAERLTVDEVVAETRRIGLRTRTGSARMIRADRDGRQGR